MDIYQQHDIARLELLDIESEIQRQFDVPLGVDPIRIHSGGDLKITMTKSFIVIRQNDETFEYRKSDHAVKVSRDKKWEAHTVSEKSTGRYYLIFLRKA